MSTPRTSAPRWYSQRAPGCASSGSEPSRRIHSSGGGGPCGCGGPAPELELGRGLQHRLLAEAAEVHPDAEREREQVAQRDRLVGRNGVVDRPVGITHHPPVGQLRQPPVDGIVEPDRAVGDQRERRRPGDRLRHRRDPEDRVAPHRSGTVLIERARPADVRVAAPVEAPHCTERAALADVLRHPLHRAPRHHSLRRARTRRPHRSRRPDQASSIRNAIGGV